MRKSILINFRNNSFQIDYCFYSSKSFKGIVFSLDFDVPQAMCKTFFVFTFKFLFTTFWISFNKLNSFQGIKRYKKGGFIKVGDVTILKNIYN